MSVIQLDLIILASVLPALVFLRVFGSHRAFQVGCHCAATLWAQVSWGVSWSLARLCLLLSATSLGLRICRMAGVFIPLAFYATAVTVTGSLLWIIPADVSAYYGRYRAAIQLLLLAATAFSVRAFACAMLERGAPRVLWKALTYTVLVHAGASMYQSVAWRLGLPLIGISRAHGESVTEGVGDVAAFSSTAGESIVRPGGLAGEPKTAAVLFAVYCLCYHFAGRPREGGGVMAVLGPVTYVAAAIGVLLAFSTSAFVGMLLGFTILAVMYRQRTPLRRQAGVLVVAAVVVLSWSLVLAPPGGESLLTLLSMRTLDRFGGQTDTAVEASLRAMSSSPLILVFGTGLGGSSFLIMNQSDGAYRYALGANIGLIYLLTELGVIGAALLLVPAVLLAWRGLTAAGQRGGGDWEKQFLVVLGTSTLSLVLSGSGIGLGLVMALGSLAAAAEGVPNLPGGSVHRPGAYRSPPAKRVWSARIGG